MGRLSWKLVVLGGLAFYVAQWIVGMASDWLFHRRLLEPHYEETASFWRPALMQEPPDMMALLPYWIVSGLIVAFVLAGIYGLLRPAFRGAGWLKGLQYGLVLAAFTACWNLGYAGVFNLPSIIWIVWTAQSFIAYPACAIVLGWVGQKVAPEPAGG